MRSKAILEELKAKAYTGEGAALGDALGDMVHWLAEHRERLRQNDVEMLMSICLALYKNELEKSWDVSIHDGPSTSRFAAVAPTAHQTSENEPGNAPNEGRAEYIQTQTAVESAIEAMVALRRPGPAVESASATAPSTAAPRRRWTDSECWSLTLRSAT